MNLFDGRNGHSDGAKNGPSSTIPSGERTIAVHGEFDGAIVSLMRYSSETDRWFATQATWDASDVFQGLVISGGVLYRLEIASAGANTKLVAEV
ncbi:MAG: hypothetical protein ACRCVX_02340 [Shewanella sp.]